VQTIELVDEAGTAIQTTMWKEAIDKYGSMMEAGAYTRLVHFSAQHEPCLTLKHTLRTLNTPQTPLNTGHTAPARTPYPIQSAKVELKSGRV